MTAVEKGHSSATVEQDGEIVYAVSRGVNHFCGGKPGPTSVVNGNLLNFLTRGLRTDDVSSRSRTGETLPDRGSTPGM